MGRAYSANGQKKNAYNVSMGKPEGKGRKRMWEDNIARSSGTGINRLRSFNATPTAYKTPHPTIPLLNRVLRYRGKVFTKPLLSNCRLFWLHYSGFQVLCHIAFLS
jgi:hypothetical protein